MPDFLAEMRRRAVARVAGAKALRPAAQLAAEAAAAPPPRPVLAALRQAPRPFLIAEFKRASPSAGAIAPEADLEATVIAYGRAGASMISVLTEEEHFHGSLADLRRARRVASVPLLRKDFVVDPYQLLEAREAGADAVLLIVGMLSDAELHRLMTEAEGLGLTPLVEAHDREELRRALAAGAKLVGVNNRDLKSLRTDLRTGEQLLSAIPPEVVAVAESGLASARDVRRAMLSGADGVLIGEGLMRGAPLPALMPWREGGRLWVKLCGLRRREDVAAAAAADADALGFVFAESPRRVDPGEVAAWSQDLPADRERVGVVVDLSPAQVREVAEAARLTAVQLHGHEPPEAVAALREAGLFVLKALTPAAAASALGEAYRAAGAVLLLDGRLGGRPDGRGKPVEGMPERVPALGRRFLLAGGLTPENVAQRVRRWRPAGVDVSGGVERGGVKDVEAMTRFVVEARGAAAGAA